jgi:predicted PurR-regulated permease PerM
MAADTPDALKSRNARVTYALSVTALVLALALALYLLLHFLGRIHTVTTIIVGAVFFSYLVAPSVHALRRRVPMWAAVLIVYAAIALVILTLLWFALPLVVSELRQFTTDTPSLTRVLQTNVSVNGPWAAHLPDSVRAYLNTVPAQLSAAISKNGVSITTGAVSVILRMASSLVLLILIPIFAAYAIMDGEWLRGALFGLIPKNARQKFDEFIDNVNAALAGYIRGQLLVAACVGLLVTVLLLVLHVKYAIAIGLFAGAFELVPYAGAIAGAIPGVGVALLTNGWENALFVALGFVAINQISGHVLSPLIVGDSVGLRPIFVLLALLIGGELAGLRGLLIAVPVAGLIRAVIITFVPFDKTVLPQPPPPKPKPTKPDAPATS